MEKIFNETNRFKFTLIVIALILCFGIVLSAKDAVSIATPTYYFSFDTIDTVGYNITGSNTFNLTGYNTPTMNKTSIVNQGVGLDSASSEHFYITPTNFNFNTSNYSFSIALNFSSFVGGPAIIGKTNGLTSANSAFLLVLNSGTGKLEYSTYYGTASSGQTITNNLFTYADVLQVVTVTYNINTKQLRIYKNGTFDNNGSHNGMNEIPAINTALGRYGTHSSGFINLNHMDEFKFWNNTVLSDEDVLLDYNRILAGYRPDRTFLNPVVNLSYPANNTRMNDYNDTISFYMNETGSCSVNNTAWTQTATNGTHFQYDYAGTAPDGAYTIFINCNNSAYTPVNMTIYFEVDTGLPQVTKYLPANNSRTNATAHNFTIDIYDSFALWQMNITVRNSTGGLMYSNLSSNLSLLGDIKSYNFSALAVNSTGWTATEDNFTYFIEVWDAHTGNEIDANIFPTDKYSLNEDKEMFLLNDKPIEILHPDADKFNFIVQEDRISFDIVNEKIEESYFTIKGKDIISLPFSRYQNHHIIAGSVWFDTEGMDNVRIERVSKDEIKIIYTKETAIVSVESFGILNYNNQTSYFYIDKVPPVIGLVYPVNSSSYNTSAFLNYIEVSTSENSTCTQNDTDFVFFSSNASAWRWLTLGITEGNHTIVITCTDDYGNRQDVTYSFRVADEATPSGTTNVTVTTEVNVDVILLVVIGIYIFLILFAFKSGEWSILLFASIYGIFMGMWLWNTYPAIPKAIVLVVLVFNAFLIMISVGSRNK